MRWCRVVHRQVPGDWRVEDWRELSEDERSKRRAEYLECDRRRGFVLDHAPLLRHVLWQVDDQVHRYLVTFHQLLFDGWSLPLVLEGLFKSYLGAGTLPPSPPFRDYIAWLGDQDASAAEAFWRRQLEGVEEPTVLRVGREPGFLAQEERFGALELELPAALAESIGELSRRYRVTPNTFFQGAWALLLWRYVANRKVLFGVTVSGRPVDLAGVEEMVGMMLNTLPLVIPVESTAGVGQWLGQLQERSLELRQHESTPLVQIQKWSDISGDRPLFESFLAYNNYPIEEALDTSDVPDAELLVRQLETVERGGEAVALSVTPGAGYSVKLEHNRELLGDDGAAQVLAHFGRLLESMASGEATELEGLSLLSASEREQLLVTWQGAEVLPGSAPTMHGLFEHAASQRPEAPALVWDGGSWTFGELESRANRLAHHLVSMGVGPEVLVGLHLGRSPELLVSLLAVLKAGAAYLPVDPSYPATRRAYLVENSRSAFLLHEGALPEDLELPEETTAVDLASVWDGLDSLPSEAPAAEVSAFRHGLCALHLGFHGPSQGRDGASLGGGAIHRGGGPSILPHTLGPCIAIRQHQLRRDGGGSLPSLECGCFGGPRRYGPLPVAGGVDGPVVASGSDGSGATGGLLARLGGAPGEHGGAGVPALRTGGL